MARQRRDTSDLTGKRTGRYLRVSRAKKCTRGPCADCDGTGFIVDETGQEKSTGTQRRISEEWNSRAGTVFADDDYADPNISASRFADEKERPEFNRMVADVKAGKLDILWFWEISRQQRKLRVFAELRDLCREMGVLWVIRDRVYDPANSGDMLQLGIQSMIAEDESEKLSDRVYDGKESSARDGKRAGRFPYGYKRGKYDPVTETFGPDQPDMVDGDGVAVENTPAYVVREIFERVNGGESVTSIRKLLNDRGARTKDGKLWANSTVRYIAMNPAYAGLRARHVGSGGELSARAGKILPGVTAKWPPLVDTETFWTAYRILADPGRMTSKPHRPGGRLLAGVASCGECECKLTTKLRNSRGRQRADLYACRENGCVGMYQPDLDAYVEKVMKRWLADPKTAAALQQGGDAAALALARADAEKARAEHGELIASAKRGGLTPALAEAMEQEILTRIAEAEEREKAASVPAILRDRIGPAAAAGWDALRTETDGIAIQRQMIAAVADIRVRRVGRHGNRGIPAVDRVEWHWLIGPDAGTVHEPASDVEKRVRDAEAARLAGRREKVMHLRAEGWQRQQIAAELGVSIATVQKDIAASRS